MSKKGFSRFQCIYTRASTADNQRRFFQSDMPVLPGADLKTVHCQAYVWNQTGDLYLQFAFQETDDPENWPAADTFSVIGAATITADGVSSNTGFESITTIKAFARFGVIVRNNNAGSPKYEFAWVATRFDFRSC